MKLSILLKAKPRIFTDNQELVLYIFHGDKWIMSVKPYRNFFFDYMAAKKSGELGCFDKEVLRLDARNNRVEIWIK